MNLRDVLGALGVVLGLVGILGAFDPGLVSGLVGSEVTVLLVGGGLLLLSLRAIVVRRNNEPTGAETDDPETAPDLPTPGDEFDRELAGITDRPRHGRARERVRERLRETAIAAIQRQRDCTREEAAEIVDRGEWTDDPVAAALFTGRGDDESLRTALGRRYRGESRFGRRARRAAFAIERLTEVDG